MTKDRSNQKVRRSRLSNSMMIGTAVSALALATPALARAQDGWMVRVWGGTTGRYVATDNTPFTSPGFGTVSTHVTGSTFGFGGDVEYRFDRWLGLDGGIGYSKMNVEYTSSNAPGTTMTQGFGVMPIMLALNVHLIDVKRLDLWAGPQIAEVIFPDDLAFTGTGGTYTYSPSNKFSWGGFVVGADIKLNHTWAVNAAFRWQDVDADPNSNLTVDPAFVTAGLRYRF
jgi:outer membrane protein W